MTTKKLSFRQQNYAHTQWERVNPAVLAQLGGENREESRTGALGKKGQFFGIELTPPAAGSRA
jgi:hypothetical protein